MAQQPFPITQFQFPNGAPVANGSITIRLNTNGNASENSISAQFTRIALDSTGTPVGSPVFWPNAEINPPGTYYIVLVYTEAGQRVAGPLSITV